MIKSIQLLLALAFAALGLASCDHDVLLRVLTHGHCMSLSTAAYCVAEKAASSFASTNETAVAGEPVNETAPLPASGMKAEAEENEDKVSYFDLPHPHVRAGAAKAGLPARPLVPRASSQWTHRKVALEDVEHAAMSAGPYDPYDFSFIRASKEYYLRDGHALHGYSSFVPLRQDGTLYQAWHAERKRTYRVHVYKYEDREVNKRDFELTLAFYYALRNTTRSSHSYDAYEEVNGRYLAQWYGESFSQLYHFSNMYMIVADMTLSENLHSVVARLKREKSLDNLELLIKTAMRQIVMIIQDMRARNGPYCAGLLLSSFTGTSFDAAKPEAYRLQLTDVTDVTLNRDAPIFNRKMAPEIVLGNAGRGTEPEVWNLGILLMSMFQSSDDVDFESMTYEREFQPRFLSLRYLIQLFGCDWLPAHGWPSTVGGRYFSEAVSLTEYFCTLAKPLKPTFLPVRNTFLLRAKVLLSRMLAIDPSQRIRLDDILQDPFFL